MKRFLLSIFAFVFFATSFAAASSVQAQVAYRVSERQVRSLINRIDTRTANFRRALDRALDSSTLDGSGSENSINRYNSDFETASGNLRNNFN